MAADPAAAKQMLLSSDYPLDKVIYMHSGSRTLPAHDFADINISHGLPFTPLMAGSWTTSSNWDVSYEINSGPRANGNIIVNTGLSSDSSQVTLSLSNTQPSSQTVYYRLYGLEPSTSSATVAPTVGIAANQFVMNTDYNYSKLFMSGTVSRGSSGTVSVTHGLGYRPQVDTWYDQGGVNRRVNGRSASATVYVEVTTTQVIYTVTLFSPQTITMHFRIYLDE